MKAKIAFSIAFFDWMENFSISYLCREWPNREAINKGAILNLVKIA